MALGTNLHTSYQRTRSYLRKTKDKMVQPFGWKQGKAGASISASPPLSNRKRSAIKKHFAREQFKSILIRALIFSLVTIFFSTLLYFYFN